MVGLMSRDKKVWGRSEINGDDYLEKLGKSSRCSTDQFIDRMQARQQDF